MRVEHTMMDEWRIYDDEPYPTLLGKVIHIEPRRWLAEGPDGGQINGPVIGGAFRTKREALAAVLRVAARSNDDE